MLLKADRPVPRTAVARRSVRSLVRFVPNPKTTPFTFGYLVLLLGTTLLLRFADPALTDRLLQLSSTDAHNLWRRPLTSLLTSAIWLSDEGWLAYVVIFAIAVAPLERRFGARRAATVFFSGHVLATLVTELPVMALISAHVLPSSAGHWLDIGVSYGFFTTAGALVFLLRGRARLVRAGRAGGVHRGDLARRRPGEPRFGRHAARAHVRRALRAAVLGAAAAARIRRPGPDSGGYAQAGVGGVIDGPQPRSMGGGRTWRQTPSPRTGRPRLPRRAGRAEPGRDLRPREGRPHLRQPRGPRDVRRALRRRGRRTAVHRLRRRGVAGRAGGGAHAA